METVTIVQKEDIRGVKFADHEVLSNPDDIKLRKADLERAMILGNGYKAKSKIVFETTDGLKQVETHIWATTEKFVTLKGGILIPIRCIHSVST
jgi:hypothetical protein